MNEKIYQLMKFSGITSLVCGIVVVVSGVLAGTMMIISGGKLISGKDHVTF